MWWRWKKKLIGANPKVWFYDPFEVLCPKDICEQVVDGKAIYFDRDHVSIVGSKLIIDEVKASVKKAL